MRTIPIVAVAIAVAPPPARSGLAAWGDALRRHRRAIFALQWGVVLCYAVLVIVPAFLPLPESGASIVSDLRLAAQFAFWGLWWPFVIASVMALGRVWCGLLCPEGMLTELASRHGLGRSIPRWMRWPGWPLTAFVLTTVYGQLVSVYEYPDATLLVLGGSTVAAVAVGAVYGRGGRRVWCRHLCPVNGVFALLAKVAPLHYRTDAQRWRRYDGPRERVDCAPLVDLRHLASASDCHACGRCSGHRGAIALALRAPNAEILDRAAAAKPEPWPARLLVFGLLGLAPGAFQWSASPAFVALKQGAAQWLLERGHDGFFFRDDLPWWVLTHQSAAGDVFSVLDGVSILAFMAAATLVLGGWTWLALRAAARLCGAGRLRWDALALTLVPLAGTGLFLGLSMMTLSQLRAEGIAPGWIAPARIALLGAGAAWSTGLGARLVARAAPTLPRRIAAGLVFLLPVALSVASWVRFFFPGR